MDRSSAKRLSALVVSAVAGLFLSSALLGAEKVEQKAGKSFTPKVIHPVKSVKSRPLREIVSSGRPQKTTPTWQRPFLPPHVKNTGPSTVKTDPQSVQSRKIATAMPDPLISFEGVGDVNGVQPADTTMAVGPNNVISWVNLAFQVFDRDGNDLSGGPINGTELWADLGGDCSTANGGDIIVHYDYMADRWFFSQLAYPNIPNGPFYNCVAVSATSDPLGPLNEYAFVYSNTDLNDYPKFGVWPDAYYGTFRNFANASNFTGMVVWAIDRNALLAGDPNPTVLEIPAGGIDPNLDGLLPSDLSGGGLAPPLAVPTGGTTAANSLVGIGSPDYDGSPNSMVHIYNFHPDFVNPGNSTLDGPINLDVDDFDFNVNVVGPSDSGMEDLPFPMYRADYRNFGDHEAIVFNHTINNGSGVAAVRWYEIRDPRGTATLFQQGTYSPDNSHRWFGSVAVDVSGDIAAGFSVTDDTIFPSISYAGRLAGDPLGEFSQGETQLIAGSFPFFGGRWGDYSTIVVDPTDQCTFWYTTMYTPSSAGGDWGTRIGSFKFPNCSAGPTGTLTGTVTDGTNPIAGAKVSTGSGSFTTDATGTYTGTLPIGTYDLVASKYGFFPSTVNGVVVTDGGTTVQNFVLAPAPTVVVNGVVKDGSGGGWPLYAKIVVTGAGAPTFTIWTDPVTGYYSLTLVTGTSYTFAVTSPGYNTGGGVLPLIAAAPVVANWTLTVEPLACNAPGYSPVTSGLFEAFDAGVLPKGWTVTNNGSGGSGGFPIDWQINEGPAPCGDFGGNQTGGSGPYAVANSDCPGSSVFEDTSLITPAVDMSSFGAALVRFDEDYRALGDNADVDISTDGGTSWTNVLSQTSDQRGPRSISIDITGIASGQKSVQARFHYYNAFFAWWWQVDDVLLGEAGCVAGPGGLVVGNVVDGNTGNGLIGADVQVMPDGPTTKTFSTPDPAQPKGLYILFSESGPQTIQASKSLYTSQAKGLTVIPNSSQRLDFSLGAGLLTASPRPLTAMVDPGANSVMTLTLTNTGNGPANFHIHELNAPAAPPLRPTGPFADPEKIKEALARFPQGFEKQMRSEGMLSAKGLPPLANYPKNVTPLAAGDVLATYPASFASPNGLPYGMIFDPTSSGFWVSNLGSGFPGDNMDHGFNADGTESGATIDMSSLNLLPVDGTVNGRTGMYWQATNDFFGGSITCIYEIDPSTQAMTGNTICPAFPTPQTGLAYDVLSGTYYSGSFFDGVINHFDETGAILDSASVGLNIGGLAFNPTTGHLFVFNQDVGSGATDDIYVLNPKNGYSVLGSFVVGPPGISAAAAGGAEMDCNGNLLLVDQLGVNPTLLVDSGETTTCGFIDTIPWVSEDPTDGTVPGLGGSRPTGGTNVLPVAVTFDSTGLLPGLRQAQLTFSTDTPTAVPAVPLNFTIRFNDVPDNNQFQAFIYGAAGAGVMMGGPPNCPGGIYDFCPAGFVTRADMAGYIFRGVHGASTPPPVYQNVFQDVTFNQYNSFYIQGVFDDGIAAGCSSSPALYCPDIPVTRAQMSALIWKGMFGDQAPPACTGIFADVPCPSLFADYIEGLAGLGITAGCGNGDFCPHDPITNGQMATFLVKAFNLAYLP